MRAAAVVHGLDANVHASETPDERQWHSEVLGIPVLGPEERIRELAAGVRHCFIGVGSVPATKLIGGDAPFTMAQLGVISFAFAMGSSGTTGCQSPLMTSSSTSTCGALPK